MLFQCKIISHIDMKESSRSWNQIMRRKVDIGSRYSCIVDCPHIYIIEQPMLIFHQSEKCTTQVKANWNLTYQKDVLHLLQTTRFALGSNARMMIWQFGPGQNL